MARGTLARVKASQTTVRDALALYLHLHTHPELSGEEKHTAETVAATLKTVGFQVATGVGGHGVVGRLTNGDGPTVLLRAELDALPITERTGLRYASEEAAVMHACGHDLHLAALAGAAEVFAANRTSWRGTLLAVGQPAEETLSGATAMIDDGLYERWGRPDVALAQHSAPLPAGIMAHGDLMTSACVTLRITIDGRGAHAATPHLGVDPVVAAALLVVQLQTVRAQQVDPSEPAVLTVGHLSAGTFAESATIEVTMRAHTTATLDRMRAAVEGIARATGAVTEVARSSANRPDPEAAGRVRAAHAEAFGAARVSGWPPSLAADDFPVFAADGVATAYWMLGTVGPAEWRSGQVAGNHSPRFAPHVRLALPAGIDALTAAAGVWLNA